MQVDVSQWSTAATVQWASLVTLVGGGRIKDLTLWKSYTTAIAATVFGRGRTGVEENSVVTQVRV